MTFSIIIPIFNSEKYIEKCLKAILPQMGSGTEVIMVDDGSTDNSGKICLAFAQKNTGFKYCRQNNRGVSSARNRGIAMATGEYLLFCDSDDEFLGGALTKIRDRIAESRPDMLIFGFIRSGGPLDGTESTLPEGEFENSGYTYAERLLEQGYPLITSVCRCVFRRDMIVAINLSFDEKLTCNEDFDFNMEYLAHCEKIAVINELVYFYRNTPGSLSKRSDGNHRISVLKMGQKWHEKLSSSRSYPKLAQYFSRHFCVELNSFGMRSKAEKLQAFGLARDNAMVFGDAAGFKLRVVVAIWRILGLNLGTAVTSRLHNAMIKLRKYL